MCLRHRAFIRTHEMTAWRHSVAQVSLGVLAAVVLLPSPILASPTEWVSVSSAGIGGNGWSRDPERMARSLEAWAKEFNDFLRDHRSQDALRISVVRDAEEVCSLCGQPWEMAPPHSDCPDTTCAWCGALASPEEPS